MRRAWVLAVVVAATAIATADPKPPSPADAAFAAGRELAAQKQWAAACAKFEEANRLDPLAAGTKLNLGLCYEELGKLHTALKWFREAQARAAESNLPDHEAAAKQHTIALAQRVPSIAIELTPAVPARITLDGEAIDAGELRHVEVDPGDHVLLARASGKKPARETFHIDEKQQKTIAIALVDGASTVVVDPGKPRRYVAYGLVGVGAGLWVATLIYGLDKQARYNCLASDDEAKCAAGDRGAWEAANNLPDGTARLDGQVRRIHKANLEVQALDRWGSTMFAAGALAIGGAALLYFTSPERHTVDATALAPIVSPDQVGLSISGRF